MEVESALESLGLSPAETRIYLALLQMGPSKAGAIINKTKLQSSTVYHILGSLAEKGMISHVLRGKVRFYQSASPQNLVSLMEERKTSLESAIPFLKSMENISSGRQSSKAYEGMNGLRVAMNDILLSLGPGDDYCVFQMPKEGFFNKNMISFLRGFQLKRAARGIKLRGLSMKENKSVVRKIFGGVRHSEIRYLDEYTPNSIIIYSNKLLMLDWDNLDNISAFVIESKTFYDSYRKFFDEKWKESSR